MTRTADPTVTDPTAAELAQTDMRICLGTTEPHAYFDETAGAFYAVGVATYPAALRLMQDHADPWGPCPFLTTIDTPWLRLRYFAYSHPATTEAEQDAIAVVGPTAPGAFPVVVWRGEHHTRTPADDRS